MMDLDKALKIINLVFHILVFVVTLVITFTILEIFRIGVSNDAEMEWNIFVSVSCFGALITLFLAVDFINKWADRLKVMVKNLKLR